MKAITTLMVQGTTSDAGKTTLVAGLCRVLKRQGCSVVPFKPQNMALNSAVTEAGGEIGRAQALQAMACGLSPHVDMNPVLIKPSSDTGAQIIIHGQALQNMDAQGFHSYKPTAKRAVIESYTRLCEQYHHVIVEGAGSPAEINLREGDIANMGFAEEVDCPVVLIADIDRGGVFAHIIGTLELLSASEQNRIVGFIINRFRGDISLLQSGLDWLEQKTGKPVLAVLPYLHDFHLDAEDAIDSQQVKLLGERLFRIVVPVLPRMSNHTDFDPLRLHPNVELIYASIEQGLPSCDLLIIPGSKNVIQDLGFLKSAGWPGAIAKHLRYGGKLIGICGGYQMLGQRIRDSLGIEGTTENAQGLGYLPIDTTMQATKKLTNVQGFLDLLGEKAEFSGYEIHNGESRVTNELLHQPIQIKGDKSGCLSDDQQIFGCYVHGLFDDPEACRCLLNWAGLISDVKVDIQQQREDQLNRLADVIEQNFDFVKLDRAIELCKK